MSMAKPKRRGRLLSPPEIEEFFARLAELDPHPTTELEYATPFELLVAVTLSAQATDVGVNKATRRLFPVANTPRAILDLGEDGLKRYISTIGLYNAKAANVIAMCRLLLERHGGEVPRTREALEALPGVGRKTANVILNTAFGEPTIAVDTHIYRVANRTGLAQGKDVRAVEDKLVRVVPEQYRHDAHHWLILHGRYVCKAHPPPGPPPGGACFAKTAAPGEGRARVDGVAVADQKLNCVRTANWLVLSPLNSLSPRVKLTIRRTLGLM